MLITQQIRRKKYTLSRNRPNWVDLKNIFLKLKFKKRNNPAQFSLEHEICISERFVQNQVKVIIPKLKRCRILLNISKI